MGVFNYRSGCSRSSSRRGSNRLLYPLLTPSRRRGTNGVLVAEDSLIFTHTPLVRLFLYFALILTKVFEVTGKITNCAVVRLVNIHHKHEMNSAAKSAN